MDSQKIERQLLEWSRHLGEIRPKWQRRGYRAHLARGLADGNADLALVAGMFLRRIDELANYFAEPAIQKLLDSSRASGDAALFLSIHEPATSPTCLSCGERFDAKTVRAQYCSTKCRMRAYRKRLLAAEFAGSA